MLLFHDVPRTVEFGCNCALILVSEKQQSESHLNSKGLMFPSHSGGEVWSGWGLCALGRASLEHNKERTMCS